MAWQSTCVFGSIALHGYDSGVGVRKSATHADTHAAAHTY